MANTAFQTQYRQEYIKGFEQHQSLLAQTVTTEAVIKGNSAIFLVADSGSATASTRGVNGLIPARTDNLTQYTATLVEKHDLVRKTGFNIFASQGDGRRIMQESSRGVIQRDIDASIITELNTGTNDTGAVQTASMKLFVYAKTILGNNNVPWDGAITLVCTPAFEGYLQMVKEFAHAEYINSTPLVNSDSSFTDMVKFYKWMNVNIIVHPGLPGVGTAAEKCFMFHKSAIGHAANAGDMEALAGYDEEQSYSWARTSIFKGAKLLQNSGVVVLNHDGSEFAAQ